LTTSTLSAHKLAPRSRAVAGALVGSDPMSRADLVRVADLSMPTLDRALRELREADLITDAGGNGSSGIRLSRLAGLVVGVDVGRAHQRAGLADAHGHFLGRSKDNEAGADPADLSPRLLSSIVEQILATLEDANDRRSNQPPYTLSDIRAIGVGVPFPVSPSGMPVGLFVPELSGLELGPIVHSLLVEKATEHALKLHPSLSVSFAKDADLGALAVRRDARRTRKGLRDVAAESESLVFLKVSHGIDAGIVCHGQLVTGAHGLAGQIGHMRLPVSEDRPLHGAFAGDWPTAPCPRCNRKRCLENVASGQAIIEQLKLHGDDASQPKTVSELIDSVSTEQIERPESRMAVMRAARTVGTVMADAVRLADPTRIVVGGLLALTGETFMSPLRIAFSEAGMSGIQPEIAAIPADRVKRVELEGAVAVALKGLRASWRAPLR
jgi:predicted NBD/HSP70 family sugar kinase